MWDINIFEKPLPRLIIGVLIILFGLSAFAVKTMKIGQFEIDSLLIPGIIVVQGLPFIFTYRLYKDHYESKQNRVIAKPVSHDGSKLKDHSKFYSEAIDNEETKYSRVFKKWMIANVVIVILLIVLSKFIPVNALSNSITTNLQNNFTVTVVSSHSQAKYAIAGYGIVIFLAISILLAVLFTFKKYGVKTVFHKIMASISFLAYI